MNEDIFGTLLVTGVVAAIFGCGFLFGERSFRNNVPKYLNAEGKVAALKWDGELFVQDANLCIVLGQGGNVLRVTKKYGGLNCTELDTNKRGVK